MKCKNCKINNAEKYSKYTNGEFCSRKCSRGFSTKKKRLEINKKVSEKLKGSGNDDISKICPICEKEFTVEFKNRRQNTCSRTCSITLKWRDSEFRDTITTAIRKKCSTIEERKRLRDIGRKGGFGKRGITKDGTKYESLFEKKFFEFLENRNIPFIPHRNIPNSSKVSDLYLEKLDLWIEIDGIDREKRKKWLGENYNYWLDKLRIYEIQKLEFKVFTEFDEFKKFINKNYGEVA